MSQFVLTREQCRRVDQRAIEELGMSGLVLMENAAGGLLRVLEQASADLPDQTIAICCGKGNNAGDGFALARLLTQSPERHARVRVLLCSDPDQLTGDAATNYRLLETTAAEVLPFTPDFDADAFAQALQGADWVVDALLGTGVQGAPRAPLDEAIVQMNQAGIPIVAVDVPSGLDCDSGEASEPTIRALHTVTFVAAKPGLLEDRASTYVGQLHVAPIGVPGLLIEAISREAS